MQSYYELLGVSPKASREEIRKAYLRLAHKYHPDTGGSKNDEDKLKEINAAYHCLKDPKRRLQYDLGIHCPPGVSPAPGAARSTRRASAQTSTKAGASRARTRRRASAGAGRSRTGARSAAQGAGTAGFSSGARARSARPGGPNGRGASSSPNHDNLRNIRFGETIRDDERVVVGDPMHDVFWAVCRAVSAICLFTSLALFISALGFMGAVPGLVIGIAVGEAMGYLAVSALAAVLQYMGVWRPSKTSRPESDLGWMNVDLDDQ